MDYIFTFKNKLYNSFWPKTYHVRNANISLPVISYCLPHSSQVPKVILINDGGNTECLMVKQKSNIPYQLKYISYCQQCINPLEMTITLKCCIAITLTTVNTFLFYCLADSIEASALALQGCATVSYCRPSEP